MKIAITGHRPDSFLISHYDLNSIVQLADDIVCIYKREFGNETYFNLGGAIGVDQWVGRACINQQVSFKLFLPFLPNIQSKHWTTDQKQELDAQMKRATGIDIMDLTNQYLPSMYQERNKKMIDSSDFVIAFWVGKKKGGTYNAIKYALGQSKFVFNALNDLRPIFGEDLKRGWTPPTVGK